MKPSSFAATLACLLILPWIVVSSGASGQNAAAPAPATAPVTPPYSLINPPGMEKVTVAGHTAFCPAAQVKSVTAALAKVKPASRPSTIPSDLLTRLASRRQSLIDQMNADLGISKDKSAEFLGGKLKTNLAQLASIKANIYLLICTQGQLDALVKGGWHAPLFYYNRLAGTTIYTPRIEVPLDRPMDDVVLWGEVKADTSDDDMIDVVASRLENFEQSFPQSTFADSVLQTRNLLVSFISDNILPPLKLVASQGWFGLGLVGDMSAKYAAEITGVGRAELAASQSAESSGNPVKAAPLDLMHGFEPTDIKPAYLGFYVDAMSRKGAGAVEKLLDQLGDGVVLKILNDIKAHSPADNVALVKLIQADTGVDLTADLSPK